MVKGTVRERTPEKSEAKLPPGFRDGGKSVSVAVRYRRHGHWVYGRAQLVDEASEHLFVKTDSGQTGWIAVDELEPA